MKKWKVLLLQYGICFLIGCGIVLAVLGIRGLFTSKDTVSILRGICDGFFIAGLLFICSAGLVFVSNQGAFDFLSFTGARIISKFNHNMKVAKQSYGDYVTDRNVKRKDKKTPCMFLLYTGIFFTAISIVFFFIYLPYRDGIYS